MQRIDLMKTRAYGVVMDNENDKEFKKFLSQIEDVKNVKEINRGFSFEIYGETVTIEKHQCLIMFGDDFVDVIANETFSLLVPQY